MHEFQFELLSSLYVFFVYSDGSAAVQKGARKASFRECE